ncbi:hypothetical protein [Methylobacterium sp. ARG-1]|uniref:hypothetical protein n=1 Tax=Methylobacterium sp. ARG-1 TaxID=1692501 RepID=UPI0011874F81|nr:hypothetical protein [Methylobacterium sp. ARG-1]
MLTTRSLIRDGAWIAYVSHDADDGGWQFHDGSSERPSVEEAAVVSLRSVVLRDGSLTALVDRPEGWRAWRDGPDAPWQRSKIPSGGQTGPAD